MSFEGRMRWGLLLVLVVALVRPVADAQPLGPSHRSPAGDASVGAVDAAVSNPMVTSGAAPSGDVGVVPSGLSAPDAGVMSPAFSALLAGSGAMQLQPEPTPTTAQLDALRLLEAEANGLIDRGRGFRQSVNGILVREHDRQLSRLRAGFDRQLTAERAAEAQARRHAIQVFERFLEMYPEDTEYTPDVMFRLAELYYDESAFAKLEADERSDQIAQDLQARGLPTGNVPQAPEDYRCSVLLYRHIVARFPNYRLMDATHYLLGYVLKEMNREPEAMTAYKGLVCPSRFHYDRDHGFDLAAPLQPVDQPITCGHLFDILRPRGPALISPPLSGGTSDGGVGGIAMQTAPLSPAPPGPATEPVGIPTDYNGCQPMNGSNGQPSRYAGEVWYTIGDDHFDNIAGDDGNALAIAAYQAAMRASQHRRPVLPANSGVPAAALLGAGGSGSGDIPQPPEARALFDAGVDYGPFWSKALYKIGWAYFRMQNGYPSALRNFSFLMDYYDWVGAEAAGQGNREDTVKWVGVIFSESDWGAGPGDDVVRCQQVVESVAHPPQDATRPFDCAGIMRIVSPSDPERIVTARDPVSAAHAPPLPGHTAYIPHDRPWTPEAYLELAHDYFDQTKYYEAITLYDIFLALYPLHPKALDAQIAIARAYNLQRQFDAAIAARARLVNFTEGSAWWNANNNHPEAQRRAEVEARNATHDTALRYHEAATNFRLEAQRHLALARAATSPAEQRTEQAAAVEAFRRADQQYNLAIQSYAAFIENNPNDDDAYAFRYNLAQALFYSRRYGEAAQAYEAVRESNENDQFLVPAAFMAVKSRENALQMAAQNRQMDPCLALRAGIALPLLVDDQGAPLLDATQATQCQAIPVAGGAAPSTDGQAPTAPVAVTEIPIPPMVQELMAARVAFAQRVPASQDTMAALHDVVDADPTDTASLPPYRPKFAYLNARTELWFGHIGDADHPGGADHDLRAVAHTYCSDPIVAHAAIFDLRNLYVETGRHDDLIALAHQQTETHCEGVRSDEFVGVLQDEQFRAALEIFHSAEHAPADQAAAIYERAAEQMQHAVDTNRTHPQAPLALFYTALAFERTGRYDTATQTYVRITEQYNNTQDGQGHELTGDALAERVNILEQSNFRAAVSMEHTFDYDNALRYYTTVATDERFNSATSHARDQHDALASIAMIDTNLGRWPQALAAYQAFLPHAEAGHEQALAEFRIAEIPYKAENWSDAVRSLGDYLRHTAPSTDNAQFRVQAQYDIALAYNHENNEAQYRRSLRDVATVFHTSGEQPGSTAAAWAAEALFHDLDDQVTAFTHEQFNRGSPAQLASQVHNFQAQLDAIDAAAQNVVALRGGVYSIASLERQGEAHEFFATQESRISTLVDQSGADRAAHQNAQHAIDQLRALVPRLRHLGRDAQADQIDQRASDLEQQLADSEQQRNAALQQHYDEESAAQRKLAIINYAVGINTARSQNIPTNYASRALEHMRSEENQPLIDDALSHQTLFTYQPGMFSSEAPGADVTQTTPIATPGLVAQ